MESVSRATSSELCVLTFCVRCCLYFLEGCLLRLTAMCAYTVLLLCAADAMHLDVVTCFSGSKDRAKDMHFLMKLC